jgi:hypothetical protein
MPRPYLSSAVGVDSTKGELGPAVIADLEMGRLDEIEIVAVPKIGLDDPPSADQQSAWSFAPSCRPPRRR